MNRKKKWKGRLSIVLTALFLLGSVFAAPVTTGEAAESVHEYTPASTQFGQINNLVSCHEPTAGTVVRYTGAYLTETYSLGGSDQLVHSVSNGESRLRPDASLTVRYDFVGYYYQDRVYADDGTVPIELGAEVTLSNPVNLRDMSLASDFWYGGLVNALSGAGGYADYEVRFFRRGNPGDTVILGEDAMLVASSLDGWPFEPKISFEGISFAHSAETWVTYLSDGNISFDSGDLFGIPAYYTPTGRPAPYEDLKDHKTFMNCGVGFRQNAAAWKCTFVTQSDYHGGHHYWFYFVADPMLLQRPDNPTKTTDQAQYHTGDIITYTISQRVAKTPEEGYGSYASFQFIDRLPGGLDYVSGEISCDNGSVPASAGSINYDAGTHTVTYTFSPEYLKEIEYRGQTYSFSIQCRINENAMGGEQYANTADVAINGEVFSSPASVPSVYYKITTEAVNGTITPEMDDIATGESRTVSYSPNFGYELISVNVDGVEQDIASYPDSFSWGNIQENHHIRVVYELMPRTLTVTKQIRSEEIIFAHGEPTFLFRLEGTDIYGQQHILYRLIVFTQEYVSAHTTDEGYVEMSVIFDDLIPGQYTAMEEDTLRYSLNQITGIVNGTQNGDRVDFDLVAHLSASATYVNRKYEQGDYSHSVSVENVIGQ